MIVGDSIEKAQCVAGLVTNSILLYCIRRHTRANFGAYKQLLTIFASVDILLLILHLVVEPKIIILRNIFAFTSDAFDDQLVPICYGAFFAIPFTLMNIHFLYRYWTVQKPHLVGLFSQYPFIALLVCIPLSGTIVWCLLEIYFMSSAGHEEAMQLIQAEFVKRHGRTKMEGWIIMDHWRDGYEDPGYIVTLLFFDLVMLFSLLVAITLGTMTFNGIRQTRKQSSTKESLESRLLIAVTAQTIVPFIFVYVPYICCLNFPFFGIPIGAIADLCMLLISCFPVCDAVIVILLMTDYRRAVWSTISRGLRSPVSISQS